MDTEEIAFTRNASEGLQILQFGFDLLRGDEVLTTDQEHEAIIHPLEAAVTDGNLHVVDHDTRDFRSEPPAGAAYRLTDADLATGAALVEGRELPPTDARVRFFSNRDWPVAAAIAS